MAKQSLNRRSTKMECTLFDKQSRERAHHGSCKEVRNDDIPTQYIGKLAAQRMSVRSCTCTDIQTCTLIQNYQIMKKVVSMVNPKSCLFPARYEYEMVIKTLLYPLAFNRKTLLSLENK